MNREMKIMKDDDNLKYLVEMSKSLAGINGKMTMLCGVIASHETRIQHLEEKQAIIPAQAPAAPASYSQNGLLAMALKAILFASATAMALAGAGKFFAT